MKSTIRYIRQILFLFGPDRKRIPKLVALFLIASATELLGIGLILPLVKILTDPQALNSGLLGEASSAVGLSPFVFFLLVSGCLVGAFVLKAFMMFLIQRAIFSFSGSQMTRLMSTLVYAYQTRSHEDHIQGSSADSLRTVTHATHAFYTAVSMPFLRLFSEGTVLLVILGLLAWVDWRVLGSLALAFLFAGYAYERLVRRAVNRAGSQIQGAQAMLARDIQEGLHGLKETRILGKHLDFYRRARSSSQAYTRSLARYSVLSALPRYGFECLLVMFFVGLCIVQQSAGSDFTHQLPEMAVFALAGMRLLPSFTTLTGSVVALRHGRHATELLYAELEGLDLREPEGITAAPADVAPAIREPFGELVLQNVSYGYPNTAEPALSDVCFSLRAGESIGIIGPSGAGKTTLVDIVLGLLIPQEGVVRYNGQAIVAAEILEAWHACVAYLPQDVFLIDGTIAENITLREPSRSNGAALLATVIARVRLTEMISQMPSGLDTRVGERGVRLSGGQRQRLALARALYHGRSVLVLDEATSALDGDTEREIVNEIKRLKGNITLIVIAHRLSTVEHCDRIYRIEAGRIEREGSAEDVLRSSQDDTPMHAPSVR